MPTSTRPRQIFVSPHLDDAILSAGDHMLALVAQGESVLVVTVFTDYGGEPLSLWARRQLLASSFFRVHAYAEERRREDRAALEDLGAEVAHLGLRDAAHRLRPQAAAGSVLASACGVGPRFLFPSLKALTSRRIAGEDELAADIRTKLAALVLPDDLLHGPIGLGNHIDHRLTREALRALPNSTLYWADQPYLLTQKEELPTALRGRFEPVFTAAPNPRKAQIFGHYRTQRRRLFPQGVRFEVERFYRERESGQGRA